MIWGFAWCRGPGIIISKEVLHILFFLALTCSDTLQLSIWGWANFPITLCDPEHRLESDIHRPGARPQLPGKLQWPGHPGGSVPGRQLRLHLQGSRNRGFILQASRIHSSANFNLAPHLAEGQGVAVLLTGHRSQYVA